jgi:hypothetical protein
MRPREALKIRIGSVDGTAVGDRKCPELSVGDKVPASPSVP